ncbi:MAG TPA: YHS domain-containing protein, partial [Nitrospirae bacterium]|nr:YHS domain-containing protein [Nitrospirota bacterium]
ATSIYRGETYYFCSANCKENFEKEPEKYVKETGGHEHSHHHL